MTLSLFKSSLVDNIIGRHACLHTEYIHGGDILLPNEHTLNRLTTQPMEHMLNGYDDSALNGVSQHNMDQWMDGRVLVLVNMLIVNTDKVQSFSHQSMHSQSFPFIQRIKNFRMF